VPLIQFVFLQICDLLTTLAFLSLGVAEANPLVRLALAAARGNPATALLAVKAGALAIGWYTWKSGRLRLLSRINLLFAVCVVWNLIAIAVRFT
jgi:hypothetical protein